MINLTRLYSKLHKSIQQKTNIRLITLLDAPADPASSSRLIGSMKTLSPAGSIVSVVLVAGPIAPDRPVCPMGLVSSSDPTATGVPMARRGPSGAISSRLPAWTGLPNTLVGPVYPGTPFIYSVANFSS